MLLLFVYVGLANRATAQVDQQRAESYFREAATLCERDDGRLWGLSLCGPMVFADPVTGSLATNRPVPAAERPRALGFANAAMDWGGETWATYIWSGIPADNYHKRTRLMIHELFHRVQPQLGLMTPTGQNDHLDTLEGRYWLRLEWRALALALRLSGAKRAAAVGDALAFRMTRRQTFPGAAENERLEEIREGLAQYTGTVLSVASTAEAVASAVDQLADAVTQPTFVRTFAYPSGVGYGLLLDAWSPGWTHHVTAEDDLGDLLMTAAGVQPTEDVAAAAARYGGDELRVAEEKRDVQQRALVDELQRRFVDGSVLSFPIASGASFVTTGATPVPGHGTIFSSYRVAGEWGSFETVSGVLVSDDGQTLTVPVPANVDGMTLSGDGWTLTLAPGWVVRPGARSGDYQVVRERR